MLTLQKTTDAEVMSASLTHAAVNDTVVSGSVSSQQDATLERSADYRCCVHAFSFVGDVTPNTLRC